MMGTVVIHVRRHRGEGFSMWRGLSHFIASVAYGCFGKVVWKLRALCHVSLCAWLQQFAGAFDVRTVFTGSYEGVIAETTEGSGDSSGRMERYEEVPCFGGAFSRLSFNGLRSRCALRSKTYHKVIFWCGCSPTAEPAFQVSNKRIARCDVHINCRDINIESENTRCVQIDHLHGHIVEHLSRKSEVAIGEFSFQEQQRGLEEVSGGFATKDKFQSLCGSRESMDFSKAEVRGSVFHQVFS